MFRLGKKKTFEMAHKLASSYATECQEIHGHSYTVEVIITSQELNKDGMVMDLKKLGELMNEKIIDKYDHVCLYFEDDPAFETVDMSLLCGITSYPTNPTAENMVKAIFDSMYPDLCHEVPLLKSLTVRLYETATGYVEYVR